MSAADSCTTYSSGGYCSTIVDYPVFLSDGNKISGIESILKSYNIEPMMMLNSTASYVPCVETFLHWICYSAYPSCSNNIMDSLACMSVCSTMTSTCGPLFSQLGLNLPSCFSNVIGAPYPYSQDAQCLGSDYKPPVYVPPTTTTARVSTTGTIFATISPTPSPSTCPSVMLPIPAYNIMNLSKNMTSAHGQLCAGECCFKCPFVHNFYPENAFATSVPTVSGISIISFFCCAFLMTSLLFESPQFPGNLIHHIEFGMLVFHLNQSLILAFPSQFICKDRITAATQGNSFACLLQGVVFIASIFYVNCYTAAYCVSLHLLLVWNNTSLSKYRSHLFAFVVVVSLGVAGSIAGMHGYASNGIMCTITAEEVMANDLFFWPLVTLSGPPYLLNFWTIYEMLRIQLASPLRANAPSSPSVLEAAAGSIRRSVLGRQMGSDAELDKYSSRDTISTQLDASSPVKERPKSYLGVAMERAAESVDNGLHRLKDIVTESGRPIAMCTVCIGLLGIDYVSDFIFDIIKA
ncbi:hypothetical protein BCR33DRAFT_792397 [Rhizoclosmatium globosum]|uniref:FZ domain-containing protein n=1 Tax=Rhizoclosmatium globosum TaxID=329046 RepID=A0A1Y2B8N6_9FUNG|nr:hypothetical protein BCR33DRAFT_792397 [Rhizoclosmatium globosum]|eukprot:ORY31192.1 hypothetical protein BCR33DRAFT_792397 [Rhizoclosmatium globosum]